MGPRASQDLRSPSPIMAPAPELMQIFTNGKRRFYSFMEFYVIHLKNQGVKI